MSKKVSTNQQASIWITFPSDILRRALLAQHAFFLGVVH